MKATSAAAGLVLCLLSAPLALGQTPQQGEPSAPGPVDPAIKCERYRQAWTAFSTRHGIAGLSAAFISRHDAFLASGCQGDHDVCPRAKAELDAANILVMMAMNAGMASTFPPFGCPK